MEHLKKLATILFIFSFTSTWSQSDTTLKVSVPTRVAGPVKDFTTDNLGNIYILTAGNQIKKLNDKGDSIAVYNDVRRYGSIYSIDATNPLKLLVYYKDFSTIIVLDRLLNTRNTLDLRSLNMLQVRAVTSSYDNNYWVYDELENKIRKIDDNGNVIVESADLRQALDKSPSPVAMFDRDGQLYLYDSTQGLYIFDYYGARKNTLQLTHLSDLQVLDKNTITARDSTNILLYKPATFQLLSYKVFDTQQKYKKINFNSNKIYCLTNEGDVEIYPIVK